MQRMQQSERERLELALQAAEHKPEVLLRVIDYILSECRVEGEHNVYVEDMVRIKEIERICYE